MATRRTTTKAAPVAEPFVIVVPDMTFGKTTARTTVYTSEAENTPVTTVYVLSDALAELAEVENYSVEMTLTFTPKA